MHNCNIEAVLNWVNRCSITCCFLLPACNAFSVSNGSLLLFICVRGPIFIIKALSVHFLPRTKPRNDTYDIISPKLNATFLFPFCFLSFFPCVILITPSQSAQGTHTHTTVETCLVPFLWGHTGFYVTYDIERVLIVSVALAFFVMCVCVFFPRKASDRQGRCNQSKVLRVE